MRTTARLLEFVGTISFFRKRERATHPKRRGQPLLDTIPTFAAAALLVLAACADSGNSNDLTTA
jgi:hypothetical protein